MRPRYYFSDENDVTKVDGHSEVESKLEAETVTTVTEENVTEAEYSSEVDVSGSLNETIPRIEENYDGWKSFLEWRDGIELDVTASSVDVGPVADADHDLFENNSHDGFSIFAIRLYDSDELESTADDDDSNCDNLENTKEAEQVEVSDDQAACPSHTMDLESILAAFPEAFARRPASLKGVPITQTSPIRCSASFHEPRFRSVSEPADHAPAIWRDVPLAFFKSGVHLSVQNFHITKPKHSTLVPQVLSDEHYTEYYLTKSLNPLTNSQAERFNSEVISQRASAFSALLNFIALQPLILNSAPVLKFLGVTPSESVLLNTSTGPRRGGARRIFSSPN
ncbi:hypothetical protein HDU80_008520 [Chytriomyces hyalinus]|nr:hypothetical protein HDU80_008520 [Chytriomyces hyalinus]